MARRPDDLFNNDEQKRDRKRFAEVPPFGQNRPGPDLSVNLPSLAQLNPIPRTTRQIRNLPGRVAAEARDIVRPGATAGQRGAAIRETLGEALRPFSGLAQDIAEPFVRGGRGAVALGRGIGGFLNPALPDGSVEAAQAGSPSPSEQFGPPSLLFDADPNNSVRTPPPVTTADGSGSRVLPTPPDDNTFSQQRGFDAGLPDNAVEVIRGTNRTFQEFGPRGTSQGIPEFRGVPGRTFAESRELAALRDPAEQFRVTGEQETARINNETIRAESDRLRATEPFPAFDAQGNLQLFTRGTNGAITPTGISPFVESLAAGVSQGDFSIETVEVPGEGGLTTQSSVVLNRRTGETSKISEEIREQSGQRLFQQLQLQEPDRDVSEILQEVESLSGGALPNLRRALQAQ